MVRNETKSGNEDTEGTLSHTFEQLMVNKLDPHGVNDCLGGLRLMDSAWPNSQLVLSASHVDRRCCKRCCDSPAEGERCREDNFLSAQATRAGLSIHSF